MIFENSIEERGRLSEGRDKYQGAGSQVAEGTERTEERDEQGPEKREFVRKRAGSQGIQGGRQRW